MTRLCELAACDRHDATAHSACGTVYVCPPHWEQIERMTAELLQETSAGGAA